MPTLHLREDLAADIRTHGAETYPRECCGALLGREDEAGREVMHLLPLANRREDAPYNRFSIAAADVRAAEQAARARGIALLGWYHSHPDHPARPSAYDLEHAWPWYSYLILSVEGGRPQQMASWRLADDRRQFLPEELRVGATLAAGKGG